MVRLVIWDGDRSHYEVIVIADKVGIMTTVGFQVMTCGGEYMYMYRSMLIDLFPPIGAWILTMYNCAPL